MHSIAIADDHILLLQAIADVVNRFDNFKVDFQCKNGEILIEEISRAKIKPEIVLMDVNMPIMNGIEATLWLSKNFPQIKVLALSVEVEEKTILAMLRSGAKGYLLKDVDKNTLNSALNTLTESGFYHSTVADNAMYNSFTGKNTPEIHLKEHEIDFLKFLCTELTYKEIADKMQLSPKTIDGYRDALFVKLNVKNRIGLVLYAIKQGIFIP